jgi:hypothetical protein
MARLSWATPILSVARRRHVVEKERARVAELQTAVAKLEDQLARIQQL